MRRLSPFIGEASFSNRRTIAGRRVLLLSASAICVSITPSIVHAQEDTVQSECENATDASCTIGDRVIYQPPFFTQFNPITALDMVRRVPGFSIDSGDNVRGFGGAAGNVLINGQRPSTKSASIFDILSRIGAGSVVQIDLIRGGTGGLDVAGQAVVVNVILREGGATSNPWEFSLVKRRPDGGVRPRGEIFYSGRLGETKYTAGLNVFGISLQFEGEEEITRFNDIDEFRIRDGFFRDQGGGGSLKVEHPFSNGDVARFNFETQFVRLRDFTNEFRFLETGETDLAIFDFPLEEFEYELGGDYEHAFSETFGVKVIGLFSRETEQFESGFQFIPEVGTPDQSIFLSDQTEGEIIGRVEFDWKGWSDHAIQFGTEIAQNFIDSEASLLVDDGFGMLVPQVLAGANTRVSELRSETFINDSWTLAPKLKLDTGFRLELSSIRQSGDNANARFFVYPKPSLTLTYSPNEKTQWRFSADRDVNQLSFDQFVSSVNFDDEDVDFGNPDLQPQRTWIFETSFERRFGEIGVIELTGFYNLVQDVEDLLPIGGVVEVPGNIGTGQIYGGQVTLTAPLDWLGLSNARLEAEFTERRSSITDPVTGLNRSFSFFRNRFYEVEFRQDFPEKKFSWGWEIQGNGDEFGFGLDELSQFSNQPELQAFIETTIIDGIKVRFDVFDITNTTNFRDRTVFEGSRALGIPAFTEARRSNNGGAFRLRLSGVF